KRIGTLALASFLALPVVAISPIGSKILGLLPFIGHIDTNTISYRQQLLEASWGVVMQNPLFGSSHFLRTDALQNLRQGEGIIDLVNTYVAVALVSGLVGLTIFCGAFLSGLLRLFRHLARHTDKGGEEYTAAKSVFVTLVAIIVIIATASSINAVPVVYWLMIGLCAGYLRFIAPVRLATPASAASLQAA